MLMISNTGMVLVSARKLPPSGSPAPIYQHHWPTCSGSKALRSCGAFAGQYDRDFTVS
jgi:hypothetical protein